MMSSDEILALYDRRRSVSRPLSDEMFRRVGRDLVHQVGRKLGLLHRGVLVFDSESEMSILSDACVFEGWVNHENTIMRSLRTSPPPPGSPEREVLDAWCGARFSIYEALRSEPGVGLYARDLLRQGDEIFVVDRGLSRSGAGYLLAGRLVFFPEFAITTGSALPISDRRVLDRLVAELSRRFPTLDLANLDEAPDTRRAELFFTVMRILLAGHLARNVAYTDDPDEIDPSLLAPARGIDPAGAAPSLRVGRNEPCPCGSGKKWKRCHGA